MPTTSLGALPTKPRALLDLRTGKGEDDRTDRQWEAAPSGG
ncbi:hypothetical protein [Actinomadura sp. B10D3]